MGLRIEGKHFENHGAYLASWLKAVKQDVKEFYSASADAEKISEYVAKNYAQEKVIAQEIQKEEHKEKIDNKDVERQPSDNKSEQVHQRPLIINFYSGPGAGKTTVALELTAELKKAGFNVEYVPEYAKELVLENKTELLKDQQHVIDEQYRRLDRFRDSVDVIVTDSPLLLGQVYGEGRISAEYHNQIRSYYDSLFDLLNFLYLIFFCVLFFLPFELLHVFASDSYNRLLCALSGIFNIICHIMSLVISESALNVFLAL